MKPFGIRSRMPKSMFLLPAILLLWAFAAHAQKNTDQPEKRKFTIHITKEVDGKTMQIDTSFESRDNFDVDAWVSKHDVEPGAEGQMKKSEKEINIRIPEMQMEDMPNLPDTMFVNGDTVIVNFQKNKKIFRDMEPGDEEGEFHLDMPAEPSSRPGCCSPDRRNTERFSDNEEGQSPELPFGAFGIPGMENLIQFGNLENLVIKTTRHGKKVTMTFRDDDRRWKSGHHSKRGKYSYNSDGEQAPVAHHKRVIIINDDKNRIEKDRGTKVERRKEGDNEVIIIRKNKEDDK